MKIDKESTEQDTKKGQMPPSKGNVERLKLFPNPVTTNLNYHITDMSLIGAEFKIISLNGIILHRGKFESQKGAVDITHIQDKIFLFTYQFNDKIFSEKIFKLTLTDKVFGDDN